jgi:cell division protein FtsB
MVVRRRRLRALLVPLALYALSAAGVAYFVHHAHSGNRGLDAKKALKIQAYHLNQELEGVKAERAAWERRIALLRADGIDRDLLEERARSVLGRVHRNDLVIVTGR